MITNIKKAEKILQENNIPIDNKNFPSKKNSIYAIYIYFKLIYTFKDEILSLKYFNKIPNVKLLHDCSRYIEYDNMNISSRYNMGLIKSKKLIEKFLDLEFIIDKPIIPQEHPYFKSESYKGLVLGKYSPPFGTTYSYNITELGILFYQELDQLINQEKINLSIIKSLLLVPNAINTYNDRNKFDENFISILLDYIYHGGLHV